MRRSNEFRTAYHDMIHSNGVNPMKEVYNSLQRVFNKKYEWREQCRVCYLRQLSYYEELWCVWHKQTKRSGSWSTRWRPAW